MLLETLSKVAVLALAGVGQLAGHRSAKQKIGGSIHSQGACLGCRFGPRSECVLAVFLPAFLSL